MGEDAESSRLVLHLQKLGVGTPIPHHGDAKVLSNPIDIYRCYSTDILVNILDIGPNIIYDSIQYTNSLSHGDLVVVIPRIRLKGGVKPAEVAQNLRLQV